MQPLFPKGKLNVNLSVRVLGRAVKSNGLPSGHTNLNRHHPGLEEDFREGVVVIEMFSTSFRLEVIKDEDTEDVERLPRVRVSAGVVREEAGRIVFKFHGGFSKKHKRPGGREVAVNFPFFPTTLEGLPRVLSHGAIEEAVLGGFLGSGAANLVVRGNAHELKPRSNREALVEGEPDESAHFSWASVMPNSGNGLLGRRVPKVEALDE